MSLSNAAALVVAVHEGDDETQRAIIGGLSRAAIIDLALTLATLIDPDKPLRRVVDLDLIILVTATICHVPPQAITGRSRQAHATAARHVCAAAAHHLGYSSPRIGAALNRDHSTILNSLKRVRADRHLARLVTLVTTDLGAPNDTP